MIRRAPLAREPHPVRIITTSTPRDAPEPYSLAKDHSSQTRFGRLAAHTQKGQAGFASLRRDTIPKG